MGSPTRKANARTSDHGAAVARPGPAGEVLAEDRYTCAEVRKAFLRDGQLVGPPRAVLPAFAPGMLADLAVADGMLANSRAFSTRKAYARHVAAWLTWAEEAGVCPLPADPAAVAAFLVRYLVERDEAGNPALGGDGLPVARVAVVSVEQRLAALNRLHTLAGLPKPGADQRLVDLMSALRRTYGTAPTRAKAALTFALIEQMVGEPVPASSSGLRRQVTIALHATTNATAGQLVRLTWAGVDLCGEAVRVALPASRAGQPPQQVTVTGETTAGREAVRLVAVWRERTGTWPGDLVLREPSGRGLSRQGVHKLLASAPHWPALAESGADLRVVRDRALLLVGWTMAQRRANLSALNWDEVSALPDGGWRVYLAKSKTDQEGAGDSVPVPHTPAGMADPAEALSDWLAAVTQVLQFDPRTVKGIPVFSRIDGGGHLRRDGDNLARLSGESINEIVQAHAATAGLDRTLSATGHPIAAGVNPYGAHSLRSGYVTEACIQGQPVESTMNQTKHKSWSAFRRYYRPGQAHDVAAVRNLFTAIADTRSAPTPAPKPERPARRGGPARVAWSDVAGPGQVRKAG